MKIFFASLLTLLVVTASAQPTGMAEFSKTDITKLADFNGNNITYFGLRKGMSKAEAVKILNTLKQFTWKYDSWNTPSEDVNSKTETRIYVTLADKTGFEDDATALYLQWEKNNPKMSTLIVYEAGGKYAIGDTKKLFTTEAISGNADFLGFLKDKPKVIDEKYTTSYAYPSQHFSFTSYVNTESKLMVWINFTDK